MLPHETNTQQHHRQNRLPAERLHDPKAPDHRLRRKFADLATRWPTDR